MSRVLWLALGLGGCTGDKDAETEDSGSEDSGSEDSGSEDSGSSGDTGDTGGSASGSTATILVDGEGLVAGVAQFWVDEGGVSTGEFLASAEVQEGSATLALPTPEESDLTDDGSGVLVGTYALYVRSDENGDGEMGDDEPIHGVAQTRLLYLSGTLDEDSKAFGLVPGWNAIWFDLEGSEVAVLIDLDQVPLELNLLATEELSFGGTSAVPDSPADPIRITAFPLDVDTTDDVWANLVFDEQLSSTWEVELSGRPHDSHIVDAEGTLPSALELPIAYVDIDETEDLSGGDETLYGACFEVESKSGSLVDRPVLLMWIDELTGLTDAITAPLVGLSVGWSGWAIDIAGLEPPLRLDSSQLTQLSAESRCVLE
jgi:hypothetical protein